MRVAFVSTNSHFDVRFTKIAASLREAGHDVILIGLHRQPGVALPDPPRGVVTRLLELEIPNRRVLLGAVPRFARHVARLLKAAAPDVIYCRDEEAVIFALAARLARAGSPPIVCDLYDSLPLRVPRGPIRLFARGFSALALSRSAQIIVTDENRRRLLARRYLARVTVLPNYPRLADADAGETLPSGPARVLVAGQLLPQRGLGQLLRACEGVDGIELWCAGQVVSPWVRDVFLRSPHARYLGVLPQREVLALSAACDAVFCFYEPLTPNDVNASPNKLYDAMLVGRPVIINREALVSRFVTHHDLGHVVDYYDTDALGAVLRALPAARAHLPAFARRVTALSQAQYCWEAVESRLIAAVGAAAATGPVRRGARRGSMPLGGLASRAAGGTSPPEPARSSSSPR